MKFVIYLSSPEIMPFTSDKSLHQRLKSEYGNAIIMGLSFSAAFAASPAVFIIKHPIMI